jgi:putative nucleotidyltransferase with HDIG domain
MTSKSPSGFHYFVHDGMSRSEKIQAWVVNELLKSSLGQEERESSVQWELKHSSGVIQLARLLANKRGVDEELAVVAAALHDIHVIVHGTYKDHAVLGGRIARKILEVTGDFSSSG